MIVITGTSQGLGKCLFDEISSFDMILVAIARRFLPDQVSKAERSNFIKLINIDFSMPKLIENKLGKEGIEKSKEIIFINNAADIGKIADVDELNPKDIISRLIAFR